MLIIPAQLEGLNTRKDRTLRITFGTPELTPETGGELFTMQNAEVYLAIKTENFRQDEIDVIEKLKTEEFGGKTKSQRLRGVLFVNWQQDNKGFQTFETYYDHMMEKIIDFYKSKLD